MPDTHAGTSPSAPPGSMAAVPKTFDSSGRIWASDRGSAAGRQAAIAALGIGERPASSDEPVLAGGDVKGFVVGNGGFANQAARVFSGRSGGRRHGFGPPSSACFRVGLAGHGDAVAGLCRACRAAIANPASRGTPAGKASPGCLTG